MIEAWADDDQVGELHQTQSQSPANAMHLIPERLRVCIPAFIRRLFTPGWYQQLDGHAVATLHCAESRLILLATFFG